MSHLTIPQTTLPTTPRIIPQITPRIIQDFLIAIWELQILHLNQQVHSLAKL
jgi:hypothetical protein